MKKCINLIFNNSYTKNKSCQWTLYYCLLLGILDSILNLQVKLNEMIPMFLLLGLLITPVIGIIGSIYEKKKNGEHIWCSLTIMLLTWLVFLPIYQVIVLILSLLLRLILGTV